MGSDDEGGSAGVDMVMVLGVCMRVLRRWQGGNNAARMSARPRAVGNFRNTNLGFWVPLETTDNRYSTTRLTR